VPDLTPGPADGKGPNSFTPKPRFDYKAPSILREYRYLAIFFAIVILAATVFLFRAPHRELKIEPPPPPPVYVEPIPQRPVPSTP
jgi:hypothetical protein